MKRIPQILLAIFPYVFIGIIFGYDNFGIDLDHAITYVSIATFITVILNIISLIIMVKKGEALKKISFWAFLIKLIHIPFYCVVFVFGVLIGLLSIIPVPFMVFLSMGMIIMLMIMDYLVLLATSIYNFVVIHKSRKLGMMPMWASVLCTIFSFIFCTDVIVSGIIHFRICYFDKKQKKLERNGQ